MGVGVVDSVAGRGTRRAEVFRRPALGSFDTARLRFPPRPPRPLVDLFFCTRPRSGILRFKGLQGRNVMELRKFRDSLEVKGKVVWECLSIIRNKVLSMVNSQYLPHRNGIYGKFVENTVQGHVAYKYTSGGLGSKLRECSSKLERPDMKYLSV